MPGTATVTLFVLTPPVLIVPTNKTNETPFETPLESQQSANLLADIQSSDPSRPMKLMVKALKKAPPPSEGSVTVQPDGNYTFVPAPGFSGGGRGLGAGCRRLGGLSTILQHGLRKGGDQLCRRCAGACSCAKRSSTQQPPSLPARQSSAPQHSAALTQRPPRQRLAHPPGVTEFCVSIVDTLSGGGADMCVKIVVPLEESVRFFIPLEPSAAGQEAKCPDDATAAQIAAGYRDAVKNESGVLDLRILGTSCTWIVSGCCT